MKTGKFCSVLRHQDRYYASALLENATSTIFIYRYNKSWLFKNWKKVYSFRVGRSHVTLSVCDDLITCCSADVTDIAVYSVRGEFQLSYTIPSSGADSDDVTTSSLTHSGDVTGSLTHSGDVTGSLTHHDNVTGSSTHHGDATGSSTHHGDADGGVLVCNRSHGALLVTKYGKFSVVTLDPSVQRPISAVLDKNHVYVICGAQENTLRKYSSGKSESSPCCLPTEQSQ